MNVDDRGVAGQLEQRVALRRRLSQPCADGQDQIGFLGFPNQPRIGADAKITGEIGQRAIVCRLSAEADGDRYVVSDQEFADRNAALRRPAGTAEHRQRLLGLCQHRHHPGHRRRIGEGDRGRHARQVGHFGEVLLHLLRQRDHHRTWPACGGDVDRVGDQLGDAVGLVDLGHPFRQRAEHLAVIDFLETVAVGFFERYLADEQQHRRAVLHRHVHADGAVTGAGAAGDERRSRTAGDLAVSLGHVHGPRLEPAGDQLQAFMYVVQPVQHIQVAFAWNCKNMVDALCHQRFGKDMATHTTSDAAFPHLSCFHLFISPGC